MARAFRDGGAVFLELFVFTGDDIVDLCERCGIAPESLTPDEVEEVVSAVERKAGSLEVEELVWAKTGAAALEVLEGIADRHVNECFREEKGVGHGR